jgi:ApbE superfamily uncharacterized protein (UPF0280 family)
MLLMIKTPNVAQQVRSLRVTIAHYISKNPDFIESLIEVFFIIAYEF